MLKIKRLGISILLLSLPLTLPAKEITVIAHRGNSSEAPENTFAAFKSAADNHLPFIEFDLHLSKDGVPVIVHDRYLQRTSDHRYPIAVEDMTLAQIKMLDCGNWFHTSFKGEKILTLRELLDAPLNNIGLMVEIKGGSPLDEALAFSVAEEVRNYYRIGNVRPIIVGSISPSIVRIIKETSPEIATIGIPDSYQSLLEHLENDPDFIAVNKDIVSKAIVEQLHSIGKKVWVWTVDTLEEGNYYCKECRVDGIISNYPKLMSALTRNSQTISSEGAQDVASDSLSNAREHCQIDKARAFVSEYGVTDCPDSPRECEKCALRE